MNPRTIFYLLLAGAVAVVSVSGNRAQTSAQSSAASPGQFETLPDWSDPELAKFVYSVVSIKPFKGDENGGRSLGDQDTPDGYVAAFPVHGLIYTAYKTDHYRIVGGTGWILSENYLVEAKMDPEVMEALQKLPPAKRWIARQHMLQVLLRDYFKVVVRTEIRPVPAYNLVVSKKGPKLKQVGEVGPRSQKLQWSTEGTMELVTAQGESVMSLLGTLSVEKGCPVYDKTGLTGAYDFVLKYTPKRFLMDSQPPGESAPPQVNAPSLEKALEEQLGLKLQSTTGSMEFIIIDHAERPKMN